MAKRQDDLDRGVDGKRQVRPDVVSLNLKAVISQRLIPVKAGKGRVPAVEVMINTPLIADLILEGNIHELKTLMAKSTEAGMQTFDQSLYKLYVEGKITLEEALDNADSRNNLSLKIRLSDNMDLEATDGLSMHDPDF